MEDRKRMLIVLGGGALLAIGLGVGLYFQHKGIDEMREQITQTRTELQNANQLLEGTAELEQDVIVHRSTDEVVKTMLPNDQDILNFVRTLRSFEEESTVQISSIKDKTAAASNSRKKNKTDFEKVSYTVQFEADAFQMLAFLDLVESHERFMRVPSFKLKAAPRRDVRDDDTSQMRHDVEMEVETYVYAPTGSMKQIKIDGFDAKRDLLRTRIASRQRELTVAEYEYRGQRNRRDPWVDPRVPADFQGDGTSLPIEEQIAIVEELILETRVAAQLLEQWQASDTMIAEMKSRGELETMLGELDEEVRRIQASEQIVFVPAERRFQQEVVEELERIRQTLDNDDGVQLPVVMLKQAIETMHGHLERQEYQLALEAYSGLVGRLEMTEPDPVRAPLIQRLHDYAQLAETVLAFDQLELLVAGVVDLGSAKRAVLIEGRPYMPGEIVDADLMVKSIESDTVHFIFRGVELSRPLIP